MGIIIDIVIVAILLLSIFSGIRQGLIGLAFSIVSFFVALVISFVLFVPISNVVIDNTDLDDAIKNAIVSNFTTDTGEIKQDTNMPEMIENYIDAQTNDVKNAGIEFAATNIANTSIRVLTFVAIFVIAKIALIFFKAIANIIAKLPILKQFNKAGGFLVGLLKGGLIIYVILAILLLLVPFFGDWALYTYINESFLGNAMYNNNILLKLLF